MLPGAMCGADPLFSFGRIARPVPLLQPLLLGQSLAQASKLWSLVPAVPLGAVSVPQLLPVAVLAGVWLWRLLSLLVTSLVPVPYRHKWLKVFWF